MIRGRELDMGSVHHLLRPEEAALVACLRDLQRFGESFEQTHLRAAERSLAGSCGSGARGVVSQGLFLVRILVEDGVLRRRYAVPRAVRSWRRGDGADMRLLGLIEAAQSSRPRLEALLMQEAGPSPELVFVLLRFAALLLSAGLRLPRRERDPLPPPSPPGEVAAPRTLRLQVV